MYLNGVYVLFKKLCLIYPMYLYKNYLFIHIIITYYYYFFLFWIMCTHGIIYKRLGTYFKWIITLKC